MNENLDTEIIDILRENFILNHKDIKNKLKSIQPYSDATISRHIVSLRRNKSIYCISKSEYVYYRIYAKDKKLKFYTLNKDTSYSKYIKSILDSLRDENDLIVSEAIDELLKINVNILTSSEIDYICQILPKLNNNRILKLLDLVDSIFKKNIDIVDKKKFIINLEKTFKKFQDLSDDCGVIERIEIKSKNHREIRGRILYLLGMLNYNEVIDLFISDINDNVEFLDIHPLKKMDIIMDVMPDDIIMENYCIVELKNIFLSDYAKYKLFNFKKELLYKNYSQIVEFINEVLHCISKK